MGLLIIARFTVQEALRRWIFLAVVLLSILLLTVFTLLLKAMADSSTQVAIREGLYPQLYLLAGGIFVSVPAVWLAYLISGILAIFFTAGMISAEIEAGTFSVLVPKPLRRYEIVLGKWLGYAVILCCYTALLYLAFLFVIFQFTGYWPTQAWPALVMLELAILALLGLTTLGSVLLPTLVNGVVALMLFLGAPLASFITTIIQVSAITQGITQPLGETTQNIITIVNLVMPSDALWHGASYYLLPSSTLNILPMQDMSSATFNLPLLNAQQIAPALFIWVVLYIVVLPILAIWRFQQRDL